MAQGKGALYSNAADAAVKIASKEGVGAFYKGLVAHFMRVGPYTVLAFIFIGQLQRWFREAKATELRREWEQGQQQQQQQQQQQVE